MALTRAQIIGEALSQVGRTDLTSNARLWLNLFLEKIYKNQDFDWLVKDSGLVALTDGGAVPSNYWKMKSAALYSDTAKQNEVLTVFADEWASLQGLNASGSPTKVWVDELNRVFNFYPTPSESYNWRYFYYHTPTLPTHTDGTGDSASPVWGLNDDILIRAVQLKALYYNDDKRYSEAIQELMMEIQAAKLNSADFRAGHSKLRLGKSFRRRF